ncbi:MAG: DUF2163 domain-containing protein [Rhodobacter sp.]|mgnify:CR=1 FL=1|jgi:uncharacterized phage protein (TIGR02218 family)|nr:DUF2163 domain-containing protein [Rhodobacter sp.]
MRALDAGLQAHLDTGATTLCRCWKLVRRDGEVRGFTDHDRDLAFDGVTYLANTGLDAAALQQTTGLSVDNSQAVGALSDFGLVDADILAGKYDAAEVLAWLVNWADVSQRVLQFRGTLGEIRRSGAVFEAELRGLTEALNRVQGRAYHRKCSAVLGDKACGFDLNGTGYFTEIAVEGGNGSVEFTFSALTDFDPGWFVGGTLRVLSGAARGVSRVIKQDRFRDGQRQISLWQGLPGTALAGDMVRLEAGCDKRVETCRLKFHNFLNYRGFPHIPGEDWAMSYPTRAGVNDGGSLN